MVLRVVLSHPSKTAKGCGSRSGGNSKGRSTRQPIHARQPTASTLTTSHHLQVAVNPFTVFDPLRTVVPVMSPPGAIPRAWV